MDLTIHIKTIPHDEHRYPTAGDWFYHTQTGALEIRVSDMGNEHFEYLVGIHEAIEATLCKLMGVEQAAADQFDIQFEKDREAGLHDEADEPGDDLAAPYMKQHQIASACERAIGFLLGVSWNRYAAAIEAL